MNDELLHDFLDEAGELLERLGPQLVALEQQPQDVDLLNAIFRAFHTVKGGAGFLELECMVGLCHRAEDVFNQLRSGERQVDAELMDLAQQALDVLIDQLEALRAGEEAPAAPPALLQGLTDMAASAAKSAAAPTPVPAPAPVADTPDTIGEDEFEALLDQLHGAGHAPGSAAATATAAAPEPAPQPVAEAALAVVPEAAPKTATAPAKAPRARPAAEAETSVRVDTRRLDALMNLVGELVLIRNRLKTLRGELRVPALDQAVGALDGVTLGLQSAVMRTRMQPIGKLFSRFPKITRDLARSLHKEIDLVLEGEDTDLDKNLVEALSDPMVHLVRNAMDHGVESPAQREKRGKPRAGRLRLAAQQEGEHILIHIEDDGAGMDAAVLRGKAVDKGIIEAASAAQMSDADSYQLIFAPGFSTCAQVSEVSGRGVGMDVVKSRLGELNGSIQIRSTPGQGTCFTLRLPLTLAILPTLMTRVAGRAYAMPLSSVLEVFELHERQRRRLHGRDVAWLRDGALPLVSLRRRLAVDDQAPAAATHVVVTRVGESRVGFVVDAVCGREEVVVKPLGKHLRGTPGVAGATVTGDGAIALILDLEGLQPATDRAA